MQPSRSKSSCSVKSRVAVAFAAAAVTGLAAADDPPADLATHERPFTAAEREHWAFQPIGRPGIPDVQDRDWVRTPIDAFVLAKLEQAGLTPAPPTAGRTLLRRVFLDLVGLPPTPDEQRRFLDDFERNGSSALARLVDDQLARPQHGERWARHWLDVARYAESNGYERDGAKPNAWRYRDYVIDSFNRDKPFDRFLIEQLAGDELDGSNAESQIATTFLRLGTWDDEPADFLPDRYEQLDDVLGTTATAFLGITLRCARCHYHKFEPFSQVDYHRMLAVFEPLKRPETVVSATHRKEHDPHVGTEPVLAAYREASAKCDAEVAEIQRTVDALKLTIRDRLFAAAPAARDSSSPPRSHESARAEPSHDRVKPEPKPQPRRTSLAPDAIAAFQADPDKRTDEQKQLVKKHTEKLEQEIRDAATPEEESQREMAEKRLAAVNATRPPEPPRAHIWQEDSPEAPTTRLLRRGDPRSPLAVVPPGVPSIFAFAPTAPPKPTAKSTGRRTWLANWLTRDDSAAPGLVARVFVNRIWQHHFGDGLVASENDFGVMGERPSHPELLDWLAAEFIASGWSMKHMHRLIIASSTYQQRSAGMRPADAAGAHPAGATAVRSIDTSNRLLAHFAQRRLSAEAVRDSMLAISGQLNLEMAGVSVYPRLPRAVLEGQSRPGEGWGKSDDRKASRRSIYIFVKRVLAVPELEILDAPDNTSSCEQRAVSTVAPQALTFLNGEFANEQARHFAARLLREFPSERASQVSRGFELALCRPPRPAELHAAMSFLDAQQRLIESEARAANQTPNDAAQRAMAAFCLVLFNANEFVYVD